MGYDEATGVVVDARGFVTVVGKTNPLFEEETPEGDIVFGGEPLPTTAGAFRREFQGQEDGFVARLTLDGGGAGDQRYGTIRGTAGEDVVRGVAFDPDDPKKVIVASRTDGWNWPTTRGAFPPPDPATTYQAESAERRGSDVSSRHRGSGGTGNVDSQNARGNYVGFEVRAAAAGRHTLTFRHAKRGVERAGDGADGERGCGAGGAWCSRRRGRGRRGGK